MLSTILILYTISGNNLSLVQNRQQKRNPFAPLDKKVAPKSAEITKQIKRPQASDENQLRLNGIIWNKDKPVAIIDDTVVMVGSRIAGRKIVAISFDYVEVEYHNKKNTIKMVPKILFSVAKKKL
jgi:hypothetical protein